MCARPAGLSSARMAVAQRSHEANNSIPFKAHRVCMKGEALIRQCHGLHALCNIISVYMRHRASIKGWISIVNAIVNCAPNSGMKTKWSCLPMLLPSDRHSALYGGLLQRYEALEPEQAQPICQWTPIYVNGSTDHSIKHIQAMQSKA
eukprot:824190-Pelagomonas_calceolata.AAC.1